MIDALIGSLEAGLSLWQSKEARKYQDSLMELKQEFYNEENKELSDDAVLDGIRFKLCNLSIAFSAEAIKQNSKN